MKKYADSTENTLVTFHTSGGGGNRTKVAFIAQDLTIEHYTDHLFMGYKNEGDVLNMIANKHEEEGKDFNEYYDDIIGCFSDRNINKLKEVYGIEEKDLGDYGYRDLNGKWMDVLEGAETGTLDEDGYYDTTTVCYLKECSEAQFELIVGASDSVSQDVLDYAKEVLGIEEEEETSEI